MASNKGASRQSGEPEPMGNAGGSSVWYTWTASASGRLTLSTNEIAPYAFPSWSNSYGSVTITIGIPPDLMSCGDEIEQNPPPPFYPVFAAYRGNAITSAVPEQCLSMGLDAYPCGVEFAVIRGQTYRIVFDGNMGTTAEIPLYYALTRPARNDSFSGRIKVHGVALTATGYNAGATRERGETAVPGSVGKSVWWSWKAPVSGAVSVDVRQSDYAFPVGVFTGTTVSNLALVASGIGQASFDAVQGRAYQIAVEDTNGLTGAINLSIRAPVVQLEQVQPVRNSRGLTVLTFGASVGQVAQLQVSNDNAHWENLGVARASGKKVVFAVKTRPGVFYRAVVVDFF